MSDRTPSAAQDRLGWLAVWRAALAAWIMPRGFALWTYGLYGDGGYDECVVPKEPK